MFELSAENAAAYLGYPCEATLLGGGVSNTVLLTVSGDRRMVLKQSLGKLRVEQDWYSDRRRIFRESSAMRQLGPLLPAGSVPEVLFEDRKNYIFGMSAAPPEAQPWKDRLLRGEVSLDAAAAAGAILGRMIAASRGNARFEAEFGDQTFFRELRIDPYYRTAAGRHPDLRSRIEGLIEESGQRRYSLVHGDWSPKNLLVWPSGTMAIDFEVIHYGDPSFDAAFLLNHLLLKSLHRPEWRERYHAAALRFWEALSLEGLSLTMRHLGVLMLARIDGKSPVEYIRDEAVRARIRELAREWIAAPPATPEEAWRESGNHPEPGVT